MRYLSPYILRDLQKKMVFLSGPRQCGKSTLAKTLLKENFEYLNWDIPRHKKIILEQQWPKDKDLIILDELHKYRSWKNYLKGLYDEFENKPPLLITGSAKLDTFRKHGDALTGRFYHYRLHPIDISEGSYFEKSLTPKQLASKLLQTGGFPEAFLNPIDAERIRQDRFDLVLHEDLRDLSKTNSIDGIAHLIELLREQVGQLVNHETLSKKIGASSPTIKQWLDLLQRLYLIFKVPPYSHKLSRSIKKDSKYFFYDCAAAIESSGAKLENLVASTLLKYCQFQRDVFGKDFQLFFFRDKDQHEVDFVVCERVKPLFCIEVKQTEGSFSKSLFYLDRKIKPQQSLQLVYNLDRELEKDNVKMTDLSEWLFKLNNFKN